MRSWKKARLGDFAEVLLGKMLDKAKNKGELHPYLSNKDVRWGSFDTHDLSLMRFEEHEHERFGLKYGDLVVCEGGVPGRCAIWKDQVPDMKIQKALHRVRVKAGYSNEFVYYRFLLAGRTGQLEKYLIGSTIKHLTGVNLKQVEFEYPDLDTQKRIASVLSALDDKIALNTRINAELEAMAKLLYDYWFVQFDFPFDFAQGKPNAKGKPYKSSGGAMVHNAELKREVPVGWEVKPLERIAHLIMGQSPKGASYNTEGKGMPLVNGAADYKNGMLAPETFTTEPTRTCVKDDLVFCSRATIGNLTIAEDTFCIGRCISAVRPNDTKASEFIYFGLLNELERFKRQAPGSIIKGITRDDLRDAPFLMPKTEVLKNFHDAAFPMFQKIRLNKVENQELTTLRDLLLPMLMNGQVVVGEAEEKVGLAMAAEGGAVYGKKRK